MGIPVTSLCHYIYGEEAVDMCLPEEAEKGLFTIVRYHAFNELVTFISMYSLLRDRLL